MFFIFLMIYGVAILLFVFFIIICIYHLIRTASLTPLAMAITLGIIIAGMLIIITSAFFLRKIPEFSSSQFIQSVPSPAIDF